MFQTRMEKQTMTLSCFRSPSEMFSVFVGRNAMSPICAIHSHDRWTFKRIGPINSICLAAQMIPARRFGAQIRHVSLDPMPSSILMAKTWRTPILCSHYSHLQYRPYYPYVSTHFMLTQPSIGMFHIRRIFNLRARAVPMTWLGWFLFFFAAAWTMEVTRIADGTNSPFSSP